jgi:acyl carrier protein
MAMKMPLTGIVARPATPLDALYGAAAVTGLVDCTPVKHFLARTLGRSRDEIADDQPLDDLIEDSLVREVIVMEMEDFLGREIDRNQFCRAATVRELAALMTQ